MKKLMVLCIALAASALCATPISLHWSPKTTPALTIDSADARVGRPLTAMSVAGVNRRMHRRAFGMATTAILTHTEPNWADPI